MKPELDRPFAPLISTLTPSLPRKVASRNATPCQDYFRIKSIYRNKRRGSRSPPA